MAIDFPASPTNGQTFTSGSVTYTWDGTKWTAVAASGAADKIIEGNTSAEVIDTGSDGRFVVTTEGTERLRIDSSGFVGIGAASPTVRLETVGSASILGATNVCARFSDNTNSTFAIGHPTGGGVDLIGNAGLNFCTSNGTTKSERARIDSSGRLLVGTSSSSAAASLVCQGTSASSTAGAQIWLQRGQAAASIGSGQALGIINFADNAGSPYAQIECESDGTSGTNDYPGRIIFRTTADGASSSTERMRIKSDGEIRCCYDPVGNISSAPESSQSTTGTLFGATSGSYFQLAKQGGVVASFNRQTNDGAIISLRQDGTEEGTISVSGTTVSYNGAHLSRWSQLPGIDPHDKEQRPEILRGTVMSNLDEMCDWVCPTSGDCQDNEQLNKTKISDVEGDKNVAGIFQSWDDDDDTWVNDYYLAMTGDFIIRIGAGVTVERGDLLMSAGDGTAKPQDDDIIRSKTIAKVTSTNVSCTYEDGSYCVPCVLMAC